MASETLKANEANTGGRKFLVSIIISIIGGFAFDLIILCNDSISYVALQKKY